jgi:hypothetical protein
LVVSDSTRKLLVLAGLVLVFAASAATAFEPGLTWDEPTYVNAGQYYVAWFRTLSKRSLTGEGIYRYWAANHEHPPAAKLAYGLAAHLAQQTGLDPFLLARFAAAAMFTLLAGLVYWFIASQYNPLAGALAGLSLVLMPRVFGHGHFAALDVPAALGCLAATMFFCGTFVSTRTGGRVRTSLAVVAGLLWGVALLTKLNAIFLPLVLVPWALWYWRRQAVTPILLLLALGGGTFFAGWPWLWHDTVNRVKTYAINKTERMTDGERPTGTSDIPVQYLGTRYKDEKAPWHYPLVLTLATVPLGLLLMAGAGAARGVADKGHRAVTALIIASALLHLAVFVLPMVPKYDGVRLFMPAFPFIACLAGIGGAWLWRWRVAGRPAVVFALGFTAVSLIFTTPYELSYYNEAVGGAWGAQRLGFETTYWGDTVTRSAIDYVGEHCPDGSHITIRPMNLSFINGAPGKPTGEPDYLLVFPRQGMLGDSLAELRKTHTIVEEWTYLGVPQCILFGAPRQSPR